MTCEPPLFLLGLSPCSLFYFYVPPPFLAVKKHCASTVLFLGGGVVWCEPASGADVCVSEVIYIKKYIYIYIIHTYTLHLWRKKMYRIISVLFFF